MMQHIHLQLCTQHQLHKVYVPWQPSTPCHSLAGRQSMLLPFHQRPPRPYNMTTSHHV